MSCNQNQFDPTVSAQATVSMSPRKLREIDDPVMQMLTQLHKVVYVSQVLFIPRDNFF